MSPSQLVVLCLRQFIRYDTYHECLAVMLEECWREQAVAHIAHTLQLEVQRATCCARCRAECAVAVEVASEHILIVTAYPSRLLPIG